MELQNGGRRENQSWSCIFDRVWIVSKDSQEYKAADRKRNEVKIK